MKKVKVINYTFGSMAISMYPASQARNVAMQIAPIMQKIAVR